ncbi:MAG: metal-dependent hydrolase [Thermomicrobiales bacterium]|nr:metal-dependent hydrolase [Thermomicrobiales bacterium]
MRTQTRHLRIVTPAAAPGKASRALTTTSAGIVGAVGFGALAIVFDQLCELFKRREMKHCEALSDGAAHIATALAVSIPAMPFVEHKARLAVLATLSAVAIDLDHLVAARSMKLIPSMTMPERPASHSLLTVGIVSYTAERLWPGTQSGLALALGLGSHLLRDLATGGAPLFLPRRIVEVPRPPIATMMLTLGAFGRWYARRLLDPSRPRRSNPSVLAPEALVVGSRAIRAIRRHAAAA